MRRKEKAITDESEIVDLLSSETIVRLALAEKNVPYMVPVNYGYRDGALYIHSAPEGRKLSIIGKNDLVCFEVESGVRMIPADSACGFSMAYRSVIGYGRARIVRDREGKREAFEIIMKQLTGSEGWTYSDKALDKTVVIKVVIESMSCKKSSS
ncbi:MAG: pyridoxamine 5'-phosphate oxidase family protein [Spirochaetes bacterium]|nr:pyridoxamine 5'-phosphate oxidase family protein [Spirochaetota bacterium]